MIMSFTFTSFICFYLLFVGIVIARLSKTQNAIIGAPLLVGLICFTVAFIYSTAGFACLFNGEPLPGFLSNVSVLCFMPLVTFVCVSFVGFAFILGCYLLYLTFSAYSRGEDKFIASIKSFRGKHIVNH